MTGMIQRACCLFLLFSPLGLIATNVTNAQDSSKELTPTEIRSVVESVMGDDEFRSVRRAVSDEKGFLARWLEDLNDWLTELFDSESNRSRTSSGSGASLGSSVLLTVVLLFLVVFIIALIVFTIRTLESDPSKSGGLNGLLGDEAAILPSTPPGEKAVSVYEQRALQFAETGDFKNAIRELGLGSMSWIERAGLIRFRKGLTHRDYVRSIWRDTDRRQSYLSIAGIMERIFFGRREATRALFDECLINFRKAFSEEAAIATS